MDFLSAFDSDDGDDDENTRPLAVALTDVTKAYIHTRPIDQLVVAAQTDTTTETATLPASAMVGKVGPGRHGNDAQRRLLTCHMRNCKSRKQSSHLAKDVVTALTSFRPACSRSQGAFQVRARRGKVILSIKKKRSTGNKYTTTVPYQCYIDASFGKFKGTSNTAGVLAVSRPTLKNMLVMSATVCMKQQTMLLGRMAMLAVSNPPLATIVRMKWDETSLKVNLNATGSKLGDQQSAWQTVVVRLTVAIIWQNGACTQLRLARVFKINNFSTYALQ